MTNNQNQDLITKQAIKKYYGVEENAICEISIWSRPADGSFGYRIKVGLVSAMGDCYAEYNGRKAHRGDLC